MHEQIIRFNRIFKRLDDLYRQAARGSGVSECALWILYALRESDETLTQRMLCQRLMQPKQSINTALKKMEADGWILLTPDACDHRSKTISLTQEGLAAAQKTADPILAAESRALASFSSAETEGCFLLLARYAEKLACLLSREGETR